MPPLNEGSLLYMPTTMPSISIGEAQKLLEASDRAIKQFPEVDHVLGKAGRANTSTDPAPLSMLETVITLKPASEWRRVNTWYSRWAPESLKRVLRHVTPDHISQEQLIEEMNAALTYPGVSNAWTMPIKGRVDMLTTGIRTPVGLKISGADFAEIEKIGTAIEAALPSREGHAQCVRGAHRQRVLSRHRVEPRRAGALRLEHRDGADDRAVRNRRRERDDHDRGARAVSSERSLHARFPIRSRRVDARAGARVGWTAADPARRIGAREDHNRTVDDSKRGRSPHGLRLRRRRRARHQ